MEIRWALDRFTSANEFGGIFDGDQDVLGMHPVQTFELRNLLKRPRLMGPVLGYVFPEVERQMRTDHPMYLLLDDAAVAWLTPEKDRAEEGDLRKKLERKLRDWLMTSAKKNVSLGIATHSISQVFSSPLGPLLEEGCPSRFFMPTTEALEPAIAKIYGELGLTEGAIKTIATSRPQQDVYYACREIGQRPFHMPLGPLAVACFARNRAEDHDLMDALLAQEGLEGFTPAWLRTNGFEEEATYVATHLAA
jgi:type IV secretion system protein VirB4